MARTLREFFVEEASEYLDKLAALLAESRPDPDRLRRLGRALRGSARMADQDSLAAPAGAIQSLGTELAEGQREWTPELGELLRDGVRDFRDLVESVTSPAPDLAQRARTLAERLEGRTEQRESTGTAVPTEGGATGEGDRLRRYLGTELRSLAREIQEAIAILERDPRNRDPLKRLLRRVRPLRGVQAVSELPAVGPALSAVEEVILRIADTSATVGPGHLALFRRAQQALEDVSGDLELGRKPMSATLRRTEIEDLKEQVLDTAAQREITWISELFYEDPGPHIESCPMAERGAGSWEAFFTLEATGSLDTADRLRTEMARDSDSARQIGQRLAYTFRQLRERAVTFGHGDLGRIARRAGAAIRAQLDAPPWRLQSLAGDLVVTIRNLRDYLESSDDPERLEVLRRAEESLEGATQPLNEPPVPIQALTYSPQDALGRALELREAVSKQLNGDRVDVNRVSDLLDEIFGLVEHALARTQSEPER